jgi:hypothetical protein
MRKEDIEWQRNTSLFLHLIVHAVSLPLKSGRIRRGSVIGATTNSTERSINAISAGILPFAATERRQGSFTSVKSIRKKKAVYLWICSGIYRSNDPDRN